MPQKLETDASSSVEDPHAAQMRHLARQIFSGAGDTDVQEIVDLVQSICDVPIAAISILDEEVFHYVVTAGMEPATCAAPDTLCHRTMTAHEALVVDDASADDRFSGSPFVDGRMLSIRFYASAPIYAPDGTMVGRLCLLDHEVRTLTRLQELTLVTLADSVGRILDLRLRRRADDLERRGSDSALRVASQVSHDLRVPLTALTTSLDMLAETMTGEEDLTRQRLLASARRSSRRMTQLVDGLLRLNDIERTRRPTSVDLRTSVDHVLVDLAAVIDRSQGRVEVTDLPVVQADPDQIYSVFLNLLTNAVKFARPGVPPVVEVSASRGDGHWRISVVDNGIGIPTEQRAEVFSMFSRLTCVEGHGIGLATVSRIVEAHDGRIGVADNPSGGTEVWFELPDR